MNILQVSSAPVSYSGGTEKVVLELSKQLSKNNKVTILQTNLYEENKVFKKTSQKGKLKIITCKNDLFVGGFGYSKEFKKTLKKIWKKFDVIHVHGHGRFTSDFTLRFIKNKKPLVYTAHGFFHSSNSGKIKKFYNFLFKRITKNVKKFTALTPLEKKQYLSMGIPEKKIEIIPNWINLKKIKIKKNKKLREKISKGGKILLYVGGIRESKGLQYVVRAIKDLDIKFVIVGRDSGYKRKLKKIINSLDIENKVIFTGEVSDLELEKFYSISNAFVLFSEWEGFGIVLLEAMARRLPVIGSDRGSIPFLIKSEKNGLIAKFPHTNELKEKIKRIMNEEILREKIIKNSLDFVKNFGIKEVLNKYSKIYKELKNEK